MKMFIDGLDPAEFRPEPGKVHYMDAADVKFYVPTTAEAIYQLLALAVPGLTVRDFVIELVDRAEYYEEKRFVATFTMRPKAE